jgi:alpha-galactosidase
MSERFPRTILLPGIFVLVACTTSTTPDLPAPQRVLFIGNSITAHPPDPSIGWNASWGMAASDSNADFVHRFVARIPGAQFGALNMSPLEQSQSFDPAAIDSAISSVVPDLVVVELGDNAGNAAGFQLSYQRLLARVPASTRVMCLSTWWNNTRVNGQIRAACESRAGTYVDLGNLSSRADNEAGHQYSDPGMGAHPSNRGMQAIADATYRALLTQ